MAAAPARIGVAAELVLAADTFVITPVGRIADGARARVKRRHGLNRSRYKGDTGIRRWVGLGVIADNLVNISRVMAKQPSR
jgi:hypothetical protein